MTNIQSIYANYPPDHAVFQGGRYLAAFAALDDIDHFELSILQYLASKMPFDKGFVGRAAFPSVATISRATKIAESTVRKKTKTLEEKGYLIKKQRVMLNEAGRLQQSSNDYLFTDSAFAVFESVTESRQQIIAIRKRAVGESNYDFSGPSPRDRPPHLTVAPGPLAADRGRRSQGEPNSSLKSSEKAPNVSPHSSIVAGPNRQQEAIDTVVGSWEELVNRTVSVFERRRFAEDFARTRSSIIQLMEKMVVIEGDPYLHARAQSINWLFSGFEMAQKNRREIQRIGQSAIREAESLKELQEIEARLPDLIRRHCEGFIEVSSTIVTSLFGDNLRVARKRLGGAPSDKDSPRPKTMAGLVGLIKQQLAMGQSAIVTARLAAILDLAKTASFATVLRLYDQTAVIDGGDRVLANLKSN